MLELFRSPFEQSCVFSLSISLCGFLLRLTVGRAGRFVFHCLSNCRRDYPIAEDAWEIDVVGINGSYGDDISASTIARRAAFAMRGPMAFVV